MVAICFLIIAVAFVGIGRSYIIDEYRDNMENSAGEVSRIASAIAQNESLNSWALGMSLSSISHSTGNHIFIADTQGMVVACSDRTMICEHIGRQLSDSVMSLLRTSGKMDQISSLDGMYAKERFVVATQILDASGNVIGYAFVTNVIDNILGAWTTFLGIAAIVAMGVFAAALLMSLVYSKRMARPLDEMAAASRKFARGDFSVRVKQQEDPTDEMGALIESFNKMAPRRAEASLSPTSPTSCAHP